mmetsp:Transcript_21762/g.24958  ORF Transcript_21762/g.24958 Transcript_21762/m.24958 type:complete len:1029 (-) Transcript_21762:141-3227(-)
MSTSGEERMILQERNGRQSNYEATESNMGKTLPTSTKTNDRLVGSIPKAAHHQSLSSKTGAYVAASNLFNNLQHDRPRTMDEFLVIASALGGSIWILLGIIVYFFTPAENFSFVDTHARQAASIAVITLIVSLLGQVLPLFLNGRKPHGIIIGACTVQLVALINNSIFILYPVPIRIDPITLRTVYLTRWCEWAPLAAMMTFLTEVIDCEHTAEDHTDGVKSGPVHLSAIKDTNKYQYNWNVMKIPCLHAFLQGSSSLMGLLFPLCSNTTMWTLAMVYSCSAFLFIFPRVYVKRRKMMELTCGSSSVDKEKLERARLAYRLLATCAFMWSFLVALYFFAWLAPLTDYAIDNPGSWLNSSSLVFTCETFFEVSSKVLYLHVISDAHDAVFDDASKSAKRLEELRKMIGVVWDSSSDVIAISVRRASTNTAVTILSPKFLKYSRSANSVFKPGYSWEDKAFVFESQLSSMDHPKFLHCIELSSGQKIPVEDNEFWSTTQPSVISMGQLMVNSWSTKEKESLLLHDLDRYETNPMRCEAKVTRLEENSLVVVLRDISERVRRFEAEKVAVSETTARVKDLEANRFTRHEVKNGLLAAIGLCDSVKESFLKISGVSSHYEAPSRASLDEQNDVSTIHKVRSESQLARPGQLVRPGRANRMEASGDDLARNIGNLDLLLHDVLETILAQAMARDVINEIYKPNLERMEISPLLTRSQKAIKRGNKFILRTYPASLPEFMFDPQLLRHIHRNAITNACKYGEECGDIVTEVFYHPDKKELVMNVINAPGAHHKTLVALGSTILDEVFEPTKRLQCHIDDSSALIGRHSSGDGAWISQKCAKTMEGECTIKFETERTIFTLRCPVQKYSNKEIRQAKFALPEGTWGIAIDDSKIHRKLMERIFTFAGIPKNRQLIYGKDEDEIRSFSDIVVDFIRTHPEQYILLVADENLDIEEGSQLKVVSGSQCCEEILNQIDSDKHILTLVRSANDSTQDIDLYKTRAHGFIPKTPVKKGGVLEKIAPLWNDHFSESKEHSF